MKERMLLHIVSPEERLVEMAKDALGYFSVTLNDVVPGHRYYYMPGGERDYADPASFYQPEGVHGPSEVVGHNTYKWRSAGWQGMPLEGMAIYELHVGTFTPEGTFQAIIPRLDGLAAIGINAIELMPVAQFPGGRNWGYDGVYPFAVQNTYGGPDGLKELVDACHSKGIAVIMDVVYNHLGPEGNYLPNFAPYFTDTYYTPWGSAVNYDGAWSDGVRNYFCCNALYWFRNFNIDGLRFDAIHAIFDFGAVHFWEYLHKHIAEERERTGRSIHLIAESDLNNPRVVKHPEVGGYGFDAQWLDDFHHALYALLHKEDTGWHQDFGKIGQLAKAYTDGFVHSGDYMAFRKKKFGASSVGISGNKFIVFNQDHDQVGNRFDGARLISLVGFELTKVAAAAILLSPYIPMLFMGEEYGEDAPFHYFVSHTDKGLIKAVREGRKKEFEHNKSEIEPPDPQDEQTFIDSRIHWEKRDSSKYRIMLAWHKGLISLRNSYSALKNFNKSAICVDVIGHSGIALYRRSGDERQHVLALFNFSAEPVAYSPSLSMEWQKILDSKDQAWQEHPHEASALPAQLNSGSEIEIPPTCVAVYICDL
jgi:maltooligosyltrehalose trehalohydrolase